MGKDDELARKARADALRRRITEITSAEAGSNNDPAGEVGPVPKDQATEESPRHFVERRMRELDEQRNNDQTQVPEQ
jgi:hypothetical protein